MKFVLVSFVLKLRTGLVAAAELSRRCQDWANSLLFAGLGVAANLLIRSLKCGVVLSLRCILFPFFSAFAIVYNICVDIAH